MSIEEIDVEEWGGDLCEDCSENCKAQKARTIYWLEGNFPNPMDEARFLCLECAHKRRVAK